MLTVRLDNYITSCNSIAPYDEASEPVKVEAAPQENFDHEQAKAVPTAA
jgi:hypothetical protein